jgi:hypothetical protein
MKTRFRLESVAALGLACQKQLQTGANNTETKQQRTLEIFSYSWVSTYFRIKVVGIFRISGKFPKPVVVLLWYCFVVLLFTFSITKKNIKLKTVRNSNIKNRAKMRGNWQASYKGKNRGKDKSKNRGRFWFCFCVRGFFWVTCSTCRTLKNLFFF